MRNAAAVLILLLASASAFGQQEKDFQVSGAAGWGGRVVRGEPAPAVIDLDNRGKKDVDLVVAITWGANFANQMTTNPPLDKVFGRTGPLHHAALTLPAKSRKRITLSMVVPDTGQNSIWVYAIEGRSGATVAMAELATRAID